MKLYVGNLPWSTGEAELEEMFAAIGAVTSANVITDRDTGRSRGFGFVEMSSDDAKRAIEELNGNEVDGRAIKVNEAEEKRRDSRGG
ncbi:MAG TPA: RNA-binding protein, partial [Acidobacteria bacterium]|nr:RNA-binding protein [Acidobacteriota bacterium]